MWTQILTWLKSKNITSHAVAAGAIALATLIVSDQQVRDVIMSAFQAHPKIGTAIFTIAGIILKYSTSRSPSTLVSDGAAESQKEPKA